MKARPLGWRGELTGWTELGLWCSRRRSEWAAEAQVGFMDAELARVSRWAEAGRTPAFPSQRTSWQDWGVPGPRLTWGPGGLAQEGGSVSEEPPGPEDSQCPSLGRACGLGPRLRGSGAS